MNIRQFTPEFSVCSQVAECDFGAIAEMGFGKVVNNRPDGEHPTQPSSASFVALASAAELGYDYVPVIPGRLSQKEIDDFALARATASGPVLAFCKTGMRSASLWALTEAGKRPTDEIIRIAAGAGYDVAPLRPVLDQRASVTN